MYQASRETDEPLKKCGSRARRNRENGEFRIEIAPPTGLRFPIKQGLIGDETGYDRKRAGPA